MGLATQRKLRSKFTRFGNDNRSRLKEECQVEDEVIEILNRKIGKLLK